jgi:hypothetical protein
LRSPQAGEKTASGIKGIQRAAGPYPTIDNNRPLNLRRQLI